MHTSHALSATVLALVVGASVFSASAQEARRSPSPSPATTVRETRKIETPKTSPSPKPEGVRRELNAACMQAAVVKRDGALITAVDAYHAAVVAALKGRQDGLKSAWGITDRKTRRAALEAAWREYRRSWRTASRALRDARRAAWESFRVERRACSPVAAADDPTTQAVDINL